MHSHSSWGHRQQQHVSLALSIVRACLLCLDMWVFTSCMQGISPTLLCAAALVRMVLPVLVISAFMNNSPVVLVLIPIITSWSRKAGLAPGHLFMPLSFASILGGTITLIGTSTNLVVAGKQRESFPEDPPITMFDLSPYGVPVAMAGVIYIILFAPRILPGKAKQATEYAVNTLSFRGISVAT